METIKEKNSLQIAYILQSQQIAPAGIAVNGRQALPAAPLTARLRRC